MYLFIISNISTIIYIHRKSGTIDQIDHHQTSSAMPTGQTDAVYHHQQQQQVASAPPGSQV